MLGKYSILKDGKRKAPIRLTNNYVAIVLCLILVALTTMLKPFEVLDFSLPMVTVIDVEIAVADPRPDCERVLILDWESHTTGFGALYHFVLQSAIFAEENNYTLSISKQPNFYAGYEDYFTPPRIHCRIDSVDAAKDSPNYRNVRSVYGAAQYQDRSYVHADQSNAKDLNAHLTSALSWNTSPVLTDSKTRVLPKSDAVPQSREDLFKRMSALSRKHFSFNEDMLQRTDWSREMIIDMARPVIAVHYRQQLNCNITQKFSCQSEAIHVEAAFDSYSTLPASKSNSTRKIRPTLVVLTAEPASVLGHMRRSANGSFFEVMEMPEPPQYQLPSDFLRLSFNQGDFNNQPLERRLWSTRYMLASLEALSLYSDAFIISPQSDLGRMAMLRGGEKRWKAGVSVRPFDVPWFGADTFAI